MQLTRLNHPVFAGRFARVRQVPRDNSSFFHALALALGAAPLHGEPSAWYEAGIALREKIMTHTLCTAWGLDPALAASPYEVVNPRMCCAAAEACGIAVVLAQDAEHVLYSSPDIPRIVVLAHLTQQQHFEPVVRVADTGEMTSVFERSAEDLRALMAIARAVVP